MTAAPVPSQRPPLRPHQDRAIDSIVDNESLLIEYGTGTGKTRIIVEAGKLLLEAGEAPGLILVPNSLLEQTYDQFEEWAGQDWTRRHVEVLDSRYTIYQRREKLKRGRFGLVLLGHEALSYPLIREGLNSRTWGFVLIDEASRFRNYSKRTTTLKTLGRRARSRYAFTGNQNVRNPADSWYITNFLRPGVWGTENRDTFITSYCLLGGYMGNQPIGVRPDRLKAFLGVLDSMRIKAELRDIRDLPERVMSVRRVDFSTAQKRAYNQMREELLVEIQRTSDSDFRSKASTYAVRLMRLQEIAAGFSRNTEKEVVHLPSPKTDEMIELLVSEPDPPTVIWYWWNPELDVIRAALMKHKIPHSVFGQKDAVSDFMDGRVNVFVSQLARGGYGLNLTRAERMIYHSLPWDLDVYTQSQERNMRLTTTAERLEVVHLVVRGSVDEYVRSRLIDKADMSRQLSRSQALEMLKR